MGNSSPLPQIRAKRIDERDSQLQKFITIFKNILSQAKITPESAQRIADSDLDELVNGLNRKSLTS